MVVMGSSSVGAVLLLLCPVVQCIKPSARLLLRQLGKGAASPELHRQLHASVQEAVRRQKTSVPSTTQRVWRGGESASRVCVKDRAKYSTIHWPPQKFVCTTLRPTCLPIKELYDWDGCASFVADYVTCCPLYPPDELVLICTHYIATIEPLNNRHIGMDWLSSFRGKQFATPTFRVSFSGGSTVYLIMLQTLICSRGRDSLT